MVVTVLVLACGVWRVTAGDLRFGTSPVLLEGAVMILSGFISGIVTVPIVHAERITTHEVWLTRAGGAFLRSLPNHPDT